MAQAWLHDADPRNEMGTGDSMERDAAVNMIRVVSEALNETHQGFANYETFALAVTIDNDKGKLHYWLARARGIDKAAG